MAKGNEIIVSANPQGKFLEGIIGDTSKPGTLMQKSATVAPVSGRFTYVAAAPGGDGTKQIAVLVLLPDNLQGFGVGVAYTAGKRGFLYAPLAGEDMNMLCGEVAGTGNTYAIGDRLIADADSGLLVPEAGSPVQTIAEVNEVITQQTGPILVWVTIL